jgi:hypothetical protein
MPLELQLIRAGEFVRVNAEGEFDLETSKLALAKIARACRKRRVERAMLDLRELHPLPQPRLTRNDLIALVNTFNALGFSKKHRLALLYSRDPHGRARLFSWITSMHGWQVRSFTSFEEAMFWISDEQCEDDEPGLPKTVSLGKRQSDCVSRKGRL